MSQLRRVFGKAAVFSITHPRWWLWVVAQFFGLAALGWALVFPGAWAAAGLFAGLLFAALATARLWLEIQAEYERAEGPAPALPAFFSAVFWKTGAGLAGIMALTGSCLLLANAALPFWTVKILLASVVLVYFLGIQLFWVIFKKSLVPAARLSLDLWLRRAQVPAACALVLMLGNGLAFVFARLGLGAVFSGGFSDPAGSAKLWLLASLFLLLAVAILVWLNNFLVIGFLEFVRTQKAKEEKAANEAVWLAAANK